MARGSDQRRWGWGDWVQPSGPAGSPCEHLDPSDLSLGLGHSPETMEPAHRKRPHLWVQGSELILILAGGHFFPQRQLQFCRSQTVMLNVSSTLVTVITEGDYVLFNHQHVSPPAPPPLESWGRMPRHCLRFLGRETEALDPVRTM